MEIGINNRTRQRIRAEEIESFIIFFLKRYRLRGTELSLAFVGDRAMRRLNHGYRGYDKPTDVLSFEGDEEMAGELVLDLMQIRRQSKMYSERIEKETLFMICHGLLHLYGYDDKTEKERLRMIELGRKLLDDYYAKE